MVIITICYNSFEEKKLKRFSSLFLFTKIVSFRQNVKSNILMKDAFYGCQTPFNKF
jgi:hypothetical protein